MSVPDHPSTAEPSVVQLARGSVSYYAEGDGPLTFLLVHGLPGSARDFRWMSHTLSRHARTVRVEMPGFGGTPLSTEPSSRVEARGRFVVEFTDALALHRPVLVGHSMGGVVATMAATLAPERFAGLALLASPGLRVHRRFRQFPRRSLSAVLRIPGAPFALRGLLEQSFARAGFRHATHGERVHTLHCIAHTSIEAHAARLRELRLPLLHGFCEDDPLVEVDITAATAAELGGEIHRFPDGGHNPQKHYAVELTDALAAWGSAMPRA